MASHIGRRKFLATLGGAAAWPMAARAQQAAVPVIGFLSGALPGPYAPFAAAYHRGLKETGYVEGVNTAIEYRWAEGEVDRLPAGAASSSRCSAVRRLLGRSGHARSRRRSYRLSVFWERPWLRPGLHGLPLLCSDCANLAGLKVAPSRPSQRSRSLAASLASSFCRLCGVYRPSRPAGRSADVYAPSTAPPAS
jgi:hypothetical protein